MPMLVSGMPSSVRKTAASAVQTLRGLRGTLTQRNCPDLLVVEAADQLMRVADAVNAGVAYLDADSASDIRERTRAAIASVASIPLRGAAPGLDAITDDVGRLICERQMPTVFTCLALAAAIAGIEDGLRALLAESAKLVELSRTSPATRSSSAALPIQPFPAPVNEPAADTPIAMTAADLFDRPSAAITPVTTARSGQVEINQDTERI